MARARNIKPGFFKNELLVELAFEYRLLFVGLWTLADREGRLEDRPTRIRMEIFPADSVDVNAGLQALHDKGFILRHEVHGQRFIQVLTWHKHQNPHHKELPSTIPKPEAFTPCMNSEPETTGIVDEDKPPDKVVMHDNKARERQVPALGNHSVDGGVNRADSLIPDSLIPDSLQTHCPAKPPDGSGHEAKNLNGHGKSFASQREKNATAVRIIAFLNDKTGKNFGTERANVQLVVSRLNEGASEQDFKSIIALKARQWNNNPERREYLRPKTLFTATNFAQYKGELGRDEPEEIQHAMPGL